MKTLIRSLVCATFFVAVNGYAQWHSVEAGTTNSFYGADFADTNIAYLSSWEDGASIFKTTDGGESFANVWHSDDMYFIFGVHATDPQTIYVSGYDPNCNCATLLRTVDSGVTWSNTNFTSSFGFYSIQQTDPSTLFACGYNGKILKTVNGGKFWNVTNTDNDTLVYRFMSFGDMNTGFAVGGASFNFLDKIYKTTDAGSSWKLQKDFAQTRSIGDVKFIDAMTGFYVGSDGQDAIFKTTNGGTTWKRVYHGTDTSVFVGISFQNAMTGYAANQAGRVVKTTDGGETWKSISLNKGGYLSTLAVSKNGKVIVGGISGTLFTNSLTASVYTPVLANKDILIAVNGNKILTVNDKQDQITDIIIRDILGREVMRKNISESHEVSLASLHSGTYFWSGTHNAQECAHGKLLIE